MKESIDDEVSTGDTPKWMVYIRKSHDFRDVWMFDDVWGLFNLVQSCWDV